MKNMIFAILVGMVVLAGCSTRVPIDSTLSTAHSQCKQLQAIITNTDGTEGVKIRCTWDDEFEEWE